MSPYRTFADLYAAYTSWAMRALLRGD